VRRERRESGPALSLFVPWSLRLCLCLCLCLCICLGPDLCQMPLPLPGVRILDCAAQESEALGV